MHNGNKSIVLRYSITYTVYTASNGQTEEWQSRLMKDVDRFQQEFIPVIKSQVGIAYDKVDEILQQSDPNNYQGEWSVDADVA